MSEHLHELCRSLVEEFYGRLHASLFSCLTYHGRLSAPQLVQKTRLPPKHVKVGLATLIQNRLIYHHTTSDGLSTYQANTNTTYDLLRIGRLVELVRTRLGDIAATAITETFLLGFTTIAELEHKVLANFSYQRHPLTNGNHDNQAPEPSNEVDVQTIIETLLNDGYLLRVRSATFQTMHDARNDVEAYLKDHGRLPSAKGRKAVEELNAMIDAELDRRVTSRSAEYGFARDITSGGRHLQAYDGPQGSKRRKVNDSKFHEINGDGENGTRSRHPNDCTLICVSFDNLISHTRDRFLLARSKRSLNTAKSQVLMGALAQVRSTERWTGAVEVNPLDVGTIRDHVNRVERHVVSNGHLENGHKSAHGENSHGHDSNDSHILYSEVDRHLASLADSEFTFLHGAYGQDWYISKSELDQIVREQEILRLIGDRVQPPALRIIRMLNDKGKLDEKTLQETGLLSAKDLRQMLARLKQMGFVDLQEVPRESQRQPNRTIYLWFYEVDRVQKVLLNNLYKAMARLLQRMKLERGKLSTTLEKTERSNVQGNEEQIMSAPEVQVLRRWQRKEQWIFEELSRLDDSVALLRDL